MKKLFLALIFVFTLLAGIFLDLAPIQVPDGIDKLYHFIGIAFLTYITILNFVEFFGKKHLDNFIMFLLVFGGIFAGTSEFLQSYVSVRECDACDWIVNLLGITTVCIITYLISVKTRKENEISQESFDFRDSPSLL